jgi:uncharacterized membrane protein
MRLKSRLKSPQVSTLLQTQAVYHFFFILLIVQFNLGNTTRCHLEIFSLIVIWVLNYNQFVFWITKNSEKTQAVFRLIVDLFHGWHPLITVYDTIFRSRNHGIDYPKHKLI